MPQFSCPCLIRFRRNSVAEITITWDCGKLKLLADREAAISPAYRNRVAPDLSSVIRSKHATIILFLSLQIAIASFSFASEGLQDPVSINVFPESIHVTTNNPSQLLIYKSNPDGSLVDIGVDSNVKVSVSDPEVAQFTAERQIAFRSVGTTSITVTLGELRRTIQVTSLAESPVTFTRDVAAVIGKSGCNLGTCHGSLHGKAGLRLSLRGDDLAFDYDRIVREYGGRRIDPILAEESLLLLKSTARVGHLGGRRFGADSESYRHLKDWIELGAPYSESPSLTRIQVLPEVACIDSTQRTAKMMVVAHFSNGTTRDVTRWSRLEPSVPDGATLSDDGTIRVTKSIDLSIGASYLHGRAAGRFTFLGETPSLETFPSIANNPIDVLVGNRLTQMRIPAAPEVDDATFLRRVYLVVVGRLPTSQQARDFLADTKFNKRELLVDELLADHGFDLTWALRWSDLLRNEDKVMSSRGTAVFHQWLTEQIAKDRPWNEWTAELVRSIGSTYDNPPASFHRTHRDPMTAAESIGQVFLGVRIQCAKCHNHPFDSWRQDDYYGLSAYFSTITRKQIDNNPKDKLDSHEITGDEIISLEERKAEIYHPGLSKKVAASPLRKASTTTISESPLSSGSSLTTKTTPLDEIATWLTHENDMFDRNMANRIWFQYFGVGIVDPPDDFRVSNPPSNPELLEYLAKELRRSGYSLRHLTRLILTSQTFARRGAQHSEESTGESTIYGTPFFSDYRIRRMSAESLIDAISSVTDVPSDYPSANAPEIVAHQAMAMPGIPKGPGFLRTFGKPNRLLVCECERSNQVSLVQSLSLANGPEVRSKITSERNTIGQMLTENILPEAAIDEIFMRALARAPHDKEWVAFREMLNGVESPRRVLEDVLWAVINSKEFVMIR